LSGDAGDRKRLNALPIRLSSHIPQASQSKRLPALEMNPHRDLAFSLFAPLIETVSGNDATASIEERLEGR
jgi:hypothetical protein